MPFDAVPLYDEPTDADGCVRLAAAVLICALSDATTPLNTMRESSADRAEVLDARAFCTAMSGSWAGSCEAWCVIAGVDPDAYRLRAIAMIDRADGERRKYRI